jgi:hypothetical protein
MPTSTQDDQSGNPLQEGILGGWDTPYKRDESFASVRKASEFGNDDEFDLGSDEFNGFSAAPVTHNFIITGDGTVFADPYVKGQGHGSLAETLGDPVKHLNAGAVGQLLGNGGTNWHSNGTQLGPQELQQALSDHFGFPVSVDPQADGLRVRNQQERFGLPFWGDKRKRELDTLYGPPLPRPNRYVHPGENEGLIRGGAVDFETEAVGLPGHITHDATMGPQGLHRDVLGALNAIGAYVNGRQINHSKDPEYSDELLRQYAPEYGDPTGQTVMVSHPDPERADLALQTVESGQSDAVRNWMARRQGGHRVTIQTPNGITDNLHYALGNSKTYVENPHENGALRPYYDRYHRIIRPQLHNATSLRIGTSDPTMAEIINHVAQTDDLTPLYEYQGRKPPVQASLRKEALPALALGAGARILGGMAVGGLMKKVLGGGDDQQAPAQGTSQQQQQLQTVQGPGYFASTEDDLHPTVHDEVPQNDDGDSNQKDDGDDSQWQKDYSTTEGAGPDEPSISSDSPAGARLLMLLPLIEQFFHSDESGAHDPMLNGLDQMLEQEMPGYKDLGDPNQGAQLLMILKGKPEGGEGSTEPEHEVEEATDDDTGDNNTDEAKEARVSFLPSLPTLEGPRVAMTPTVPVDGNGLPIPPVTPAAATPFQSSPGTCPQCGGVVDPTNSVCPQCGASTTSLPQNNGVKLTAELAPDMNYIQTDLPPGMTIDQYRRNRFPFHPCENCGSDLDPNDLECAVCHAPVGLHMTAAAHQGPHTPEQISAVQQYLIDNGRVDEVPQVPLYPQNYADILAELTNSDVPPPVDDTQGGLPQPAQEEAPPGDTMPMPGMTPPPGAQQMMAAVEKYALKGEHNHVVDPTADEATRPEDIESERDTSMTWVDSDGNPLKVGQYYDLYSQQYDIPDLIRIEGVKPDALDYTLQGNMGLEQQVTVDRREANLMGYSFQPSSQGADAEMVPDQLEANNDDNTSFEGAPEQTDLSAPHNTYASSVTEDGDDVRPGYWGSTEPQKLSWLNNGSEPETDDGSGRGWLREAGRQYNNWEQRDFIDEKGVARNADKLDLVGTHYESNLTDADDSEFLFGL